MSSQLQTLTPVLQRLRVVRLVSLSSTLAPKKDRKDIMKEQLHKTEKAGKLSKALSSRQRI